MKKYAVTAPKRSKTNPALALRIARAKLSGMRAMMKNSTEVAGAAPLAPSRTGVQFIQCWAVQRGHATFTQALDNTGQVWEQMSRKKDDGEGRESWWFPLSMERRATSEPKATAP